MWCRFHILRCILQAMWLACPTANLSMLLLRIWCGPLREWHGVSLTMRLIIIVVGGIGGVKRWVCTAVISRIAMHCWSDDAGAAGWCFLRGVRVVVLFQYFLPAARPCIGVEARCRMGLLPGVGTQQILGQSLGFSWCRWWSSVKTWWCICHWLSLVGSDIRYWTITSRLGLVAILLWGWCEWSRISSRYTIGITTGLYFWSDRLCLWIVWLRRRNQILKVRRQRFGTRLPMVVVITTVETTKWMFYRFSTAIRFIVQFAFKNSLISRRKWCRWRLGEWWPR